MTYGYDSDQRRIPIQRANSWDYIPCKREQGEPGYEMDFQDAFRIGKVQRWLRALDALDHNACDAIMAMYGDCGSRWGRDPVLYQLTASGQKIVAKVRVRCGTIAFEMSDLEILANEEADQERRPTKRRGRDIDAMKTEALMLKQRAVKLLVRVAT